MDFGRWIGHWIRGPDAWTPNDFSHDKFIAVLAGGLGEPEGSLNAIRSVLFKKHHIYSVVGATFRITNWPPYPYKKTKRLGKDYYDCTKKYLEAHPESSVILIGHSLGGLMSLYVAHCLQKEGYGDRLRRVFLLGTPLYGLDPEFLFLNSFLARKLYFNHVGDKLTELTEFLLTDVPREKIVTIYSNEDGLVHNDHATIPGATNVRVNSGHLLMVASVEVAGIIYKNLSC